MGQCLKQTFYKDLSNNEYSFSINVRTVRINGAVGAICFPVVHNLISFLGKEHPQMLKGVLLNNIAGKNAFLNTRK